MSRYELIKLAARCHRAKWDFDVPDNMPKAEMRQMIAKAFDTLHRIGDEAKAAADLNP